MWKCYSKIGVKMLLTGHVIEATSYAPSRASQMLCKLMPWTSDAPESLNAARAGPGVFEPGDWAEDAADQLCR